jgi:glyoxylase-like metal-dependent hydrolase (beta-lactamase superfamily II)
MKRLAMTAALLASTFASHAQTEQALSWEAEELAPGLYMLMGAGGFTGGNIGLSVGPDGVVMIDDAMPSSLDILQQAIRGITEQKIEFLINTHVHGDHTGNNVVFAEGGAHIVAHDNLRAHLLEHGVQGADGMQPAPEKSLPVITFSEEMSFHLNDQPARLMHLPHAHTDGDAAIYFPDADVLHAGDVFFHGLFPYIDIDSGGSVQGYIDGQQRLLDLIGDDIKIIPGHGPLASKADLADDLAMLKDAAAIIQQHIDQGRSADEVVAANPLAKYHDGYNWGFISTERMTRQLYRGLSSSGATHQHGQAGAHSH